MIAESTLRAVEDVAIALKELRDRPFGPEATGDARLVAGNACVELAGTPDTARTLWKLVVEDSGGYMPNVVARALWRASQTSNLVPDVAAPDPS